MEIAPKHLSSHPKAVTTLKQDASGRLPQGTSAPGAASAQAEGRAQLVGSNPKPRCFVCCEGPPFWFFFLRDPAFCVALKRFSEGTPFFCGFNGEF